MLPCFFRVFSAWTRPNSVILTSFESCCLVSLLHFLLVDISCLTCPECLLMKTASQMVFNLN